jgi:hypothetical protein
VGECGGAADTNMSRWNLRLRRFSQRRTGRETLDAPAVRWGGSLRP